MTIKQRQHLLAYLGYYVGNVDGDWGTLSKTSCTAFQRDANITDDGHGGPETDKALRNAVANDKFKVDKDTEEETGTFWDEIEFWEREEFRCQCGGKYCNGFPEEPDEKLVRLVENVRRHFGRPGHRSSGLRCPQWNSIQGGVSNSKHMYGKALDFRIEGKSSKQVLDYVLSLPGVNYAYEIDSQHVHVDVN